MSANTQTLVGQAPKPSAEPADTTSTKTGRKRKTPAKASELASHGGVGWSLEENRTLWWMRHKLVGGRCEYYRSIGIALGRTALACRGAMCKLLKDYTVVGYEGLFEQPRPFGLGEPGENLEKPASPSKGKKACIAKGQKAAADYASEVEVIRLAKEEAASADCLSKAETFRRGKARMDAADRRLRKRAHRETKARIESEIRAASESAERVARESVQFRTADGHSSPVAGLENNKSTEFADHQKQERVMHHRRMVQCTHEPVPGPEGETGEPEFEETREIVHPRELDAAGALLKAVDGTPARRSPNRQSIAEKERQQRDPRMDINFVTNND